MDANKVINEIKGRMNDKNKYFIIQKKARKEKNEYKNRRYTFKWSVDNVNLEANGLST